MKELEVCGLRTVTMMKKLEVCGWCTVNMMKELESCGRRTVTIMKEFEVFSWRAKIYQMKVHGSKVRGPSLHSAASFTPEMMSAWPGQWYDIQSHCHQTTCSG